MFTTNGVIRQAVENGYTWRVSLEVSIASGVTRILGFLTGNMVVALEQRDIASTGDDTTVLIYEDISYTGGTPLTPQNRNRAFQGDATKNPLVEFMDNVTATPAGAPITGAHLVFANRGVGSFGADPEASTILLKPNTSHIVTILNSDGAPRTVGLGAIFRKAQFEA